MISARKLLIAVAAVTAAATLGACSSSGGGSSSDTGGATQPATTGGASGGGGTSHAAGTPIKVGMICSCTGPFGTTIAAAGETAKAWVKAVNASGGINGHPVELTAYDDGGNPGTGATKAKSLISAKVDVILDLTPLDAVWAKSVTDAKIPVVGGNFSAEPYLTNPNFYTSGQTNDSIVTANVLTAKAAGVKKMGQLYCAEAPQCQQSVAPHKKAGKKLGVPFVYSASISATAPNYTAQCLAAKQAGVDGLFIGDSTSVIVRVIKDCNQQGYNPVYITEGTGFTMELVDALGSDGKWASPFPILPFFADKPPVKKMNAALDKYAPGVRTDEKTFSEYAAQAWTGGLLIEKAVEASGAAASAEVTPALVTKGLNSLKNETLNGWSPQLTFTTGQPHLVDCWFTATIENGKPVMSNNGELTCSKSVS